MKKSLMLLKVILILILVFPITTHAPEFEWEDEGEPPFWSKLSELTEWSNDIIQYFIEEANRYNVPVELALAVAHIETGGTFRFDLVNKTSGATGLFQIMGGSTLKEITTGLEREGRVFESYDRLDPMFNITCGMWYLNHLRERHDYETKHELLTAYNRGHTGMKRFVSINGSAVSGYSRTVLKLTNQFREELQ